MTTTNINPNQINLFPAGKESLSGDAADSDLKKRVCTSMRTMIKAQEEAVEQIVSNPLKRYPPEIFACGFSDLITMVLQGVGCFVSCLAITISLSIFSFLGAAFNIKEGALGIKEGWESWKSGNKGLGLRLLLQGTLECGLGAVMLIIGIAGVAAFTSVVGFFVSNPYILPVLFFCLSIFLLIEQGGHWWRATVSKTHLGAQLKLPELRTELFDEEKSSASQWESARKWVMDHLNEGGKLGGPELDRNLGEKIDHYKAEVGFPAAMAIFNLFQTILQEEEKERALKEKLESEIAALKQDYANQIQELKKNSSEEIDQDTQLKIEKAKNLLENAILQLTETHKKEIEDLRAFEQQNVKSHIGVVEKKMNVWKGALYIKLFSVFLFTAGFATAMSAIFLRSIALNATQYFLSGCAGLPSQTLDTSAHDREIPVTPPPAFRKAQKNI